MCRDMLNRIVMYNPVQFSLNSHQQLDLWKLDKIFLFLTLAVIWCCEKEHAGDMHN
jgi:hypothetical protein